MPGHDCEQNCQPKDSSIGKFPVLDKVLLRIGFYGFLVVGAYAVYSMSLLWGLIYTVFAVLSLALAAYCLCSHCIHAYQYSDCLLLPSRLVTNMYRFRPEPMSRLDTVGFTLWYVGTVGIPQYWLVQNPVLLAIFWVLCVGASVGHGWRYCVGGRCLNRTCFTHPERKKALREYEGKALPGNDTQLTDR